MAWNMRKLKELVGLLSIYRLLLQLLIGYWLVSGIFRRFLKAAKVTPVKERVKAALRTVGLRKTAIENILKVFAHETGGFNSRLLKEQNNLCGMRHPAKRETYSRGEASGYAYYDSVEDSALDFIEWLKYNGCTIEELNKMSVSQLVIFMKRKMYFEDNLVNYLNAVRSWDV